MKALWIFLILIVFCIYVLIGLHITDGLESSVQVVLSWVIYTLMCTTFLNVFILGYFWSVIREKKGPTGLRGPSGENGKIGLKGTCSIDATEAFLIKTLNEYIDGLYFSKTNKHIVNDDTQKFPCKYLNNKIQSMAGSKQYKVVIANLAKDNKPVNNIVNYIKNIWSKWFELIYNSTNTLGAWFEDEYADEEYEWSQNKNPFDEIKKYDIYYWGITRDFRPLKAEICRSSSSYKNSKLPLPNGKLRARLQLIESNDYYRVGDNQSDDQNEDSSWWSPNIITIGSETYYPMADVFTDQVQYHNKKGKMINGDVSYDPPPNDTGPANGNGPDMKTMLVNGDVVDPIGYDHVDSPQANDNVQIYTLKCPDGYQSIGDVTNSNYHAFNQFKCIPSECVEVNDKPKYNIWNKYHRWYEHNIFSGNYGWNYTWDFNINVLNPDWRNKLDATPDNSYNTFRVHHSKPFYKIKDSCLIAPEQKSVNKDIEPENGDLGIGWNGHPYKLDPKYSIFTFLDLVPEGMIVNQGTGRRFYIIHYGGEDGNIYIILDLNDKTQKYDSALQVKDTTKSSQGSSTSLVVSRKIVKMDERQQWVIVLSSDKKHFTLKNVINNKYLYLGVEPQHGITQFSTIDLDNNNYKKNPVFSQLNQDDINNGTIFTFIPSFGANLNIIDK